MTTRRFDRRQGFLISATVHLMILTLLGTVAEKASRPETTPSPTPAPPEARRVRLLPPRELRALRVAPVPVPPPPAGRDRISIGPPSTERRRDLVLRRDEDLSSAPAGPGGPPKAGPPSPPPPAAAPSPPPMTAEGSQAPGVRGPGLSPDPRGGAAAVTRGPERSPSIGRSLRDLDRRLGQMGTGPLPGGAGRQMGPLFFDPEGADFTGWINHFKNEVYRNWIVPQAALFGFRGGHVDIEFWVERDGSMTELRILKSSGTPALDRAAQNALTGSRLLALPADFGPQRVHMQVSFFYNEAPQG